MSKRITAKELLDKYLDGTASEEEQALLESWQLQFPLEGRKTLTAKQRRQDIAIVRKALGQPSSGRVIRLTVGIAASLLVAGLTAVFLYLRQPLRKQQNAEALLPAKNGVTLTLGNGQRLVLQSGHRGLVGSGSLATQKDSLLNYPSASVTATTELNTVTNNSGHRFSLVLSDGSEVTLDVQSSLTYPVVFSGSRREVNATGQVYFKVKHDAEHPFFVQLSLQRIQDIGTAFNVNTFDTDQTTLVEGAVSVNQQPLIPGEMATTVGNAVQVTQANLTEVTAWLQDKISYKNATLEHIMNEVSRVYQVKIVWQDEALKQRAFIVKLNRSTPLSNILNYFRATSNIDFKVEGKTVTIFKKKSTD